MNKWNNLLTLPDGEYLSKHTHKNGRELQVRIESLIASRSKLDDLEQSFKSASLTDVKDWSELPKKRASLLVEEMAIRKELDKFYQDAKNDYRRYRERKYEEYMKSQQELKTRLIEIGYTEQSLIGSDIIPRYPKVKELRMITDCHSLDNSQEIENKEMISLLENELRTMRSRCLI